MLFLSRPLFLLVALFMLQANLCVPLPALAQDNSATNNLTDNPALRLQRDIARQQSSQNLVNRLNDLSGPYDGRQFINRRLGNGVNPSELIPLFEYDYNGDGSISVNEAVRHSRENFSRFDEDNNQAITQRDIENYYKKISRGGINFGQYTPKSMAQITFNAMANQDKNNDGKIEFSEYAAGNGQLMAGFDLNNNGIVTAEESIYAPQVKLQQAIDNINKAPTKKPSLTKSYPQPQFSPDLIKRYQSLNERNNLNRYNNQELTPDLANELRQKMLPLLPESVRAQFEQSIIEKTSTTPNSTRQTINTNQPNLTNNQGDNARENTRKNPTIKGSAQGPITGNDTAPIKGIVPQDNKPTYSPKPIIIP